MPKIFTITSTVVGLFIYGLSTYATYSDEIRLSRYYWLIGISSAVVAHAIWLWLAQSAGDQRRILLYGLFWDIGFTAISVAMPVIFFKQKFSPVGYLAVAMIVVGGIVLKEFGFSS